ncbi:hypothetical protein HanXRQr2_Chr09g0376241 [Helianthus annuus]|uniref:Uncharacterized protein n=1 Tax=Helianthus annuus TaxID=4232 RepID=A0A9K3N835_HELAN|nr:hypothetical protein HanXRQr2_Chr09g0376241 [Helianthus annuus]KAJ0525186.1 hypothetical protein HanHA300_Chr09g0309101 [Helianthus annuus]
MLNLCMCTLYIHVFIVTISTCTYITFDTIANRKLLMACKSISSITAGDGAEPIEIRVIRKCLSFVYKEEYCFLFVDREGTAIEAIGSKRDKAFLDAKLVLQSCYRVTNYLSARARQSHNVVPRAATIKLGLGRGTHFTPIDDSAFPTNYFNFLPFNRLRDREGNHFLLTGSFTYFCILDINTQFSD